MADRNDYLQTDYMAQMIHIDDFDEATEILKSPKFLQGAYGLSRQTMMRDTLTTLDGERHWQHRHVLAQLFTKQVLEEFRSTYLLPIIEQTLREISSGPRPADGVARGDLAPLVQRCLHRLGAAMGGIDGLESPEAADLFIKRVRGMTAGFTVEWTREADPDEVVRRGLAEQEIFRREFFNPSYERRAKLIAEARAAGREISEVARDYLSLIIAHLGGRFTGDDDLPFREISIFLTGATQGTAHSTVSFVLRLEKWLAAHPEDRALLLSDPEFLRRASFESLRMTVASPARIRTASEDVTLSTGRVIKAGEKVALLFIQANTDPKRFGEDAADYNPHRSFHDAAPWGLAFGAGAHACPGRPMATGTLSLKGKAEADGSMVALVRRLYEAGLELDPENPPVPDPSTHYDLYTNVPLRFTKL